MGSQQFCHENTSTYYRPVQKPTPFVACFADNSFGHNQCSQGLWSTNLTTSKLMCSLWHDSRIFRCFYLKSLHFRNLPLWCHQVACLWQLKVVVVFHHNINDFIVSCHSIQCYRHPSFAIRSCFSSKTLWQIFQCLPFSPKALIGTNKSTWSHFTIKLDNIFVSFPHIKPCTTPIVNPKHPSFVWISEPHTNLGYPFVNFSHCKTLENAQHSQLHSTTIKFFCSWVLRRSEIAGHCGAGGCRSGAETVVAGAEAEEAVAAGAEEEQRRWPSERAGWGP